MEGKRYASTSSLPNGGGAQIMSPEIVEVVEDSRSITNGIDGLVTDVYVAVGKDDLDVLKWALYNCVSPGARVFLIHVFPPLTYINTPAGRLSRHQLSPDQLRFYIDEENNARRSKMEKYIHLCKEAKVTVDTMLLESNLTAKAILELVPILNITKLVIGTKRLPSSRLQIRRKPRKADFVRKNAPEYCEVTIIHDGKKITDSQQVTQAAPSSPSSGHRRPHIASYCKKKFFECTCFSVCKTKVNDS